MSRFSHVTSIASIAAAGAMTSFFLLQVRMVA